MRSVAPCVALLLALTVGQAEAGTSTIDFSPLAGFAGGIVDQWTFTEGPWFVVVRSVEVIGPGDPAYTGAIGIVGIPEQSNVQIFYEPVASTLSMFDLASAAATFAPDTGPTVAWQGIGDAGSSIPLEFSGTAPATLASDPIFGPTPISSLILSADLSNQAQLISVTLDPPGPPAGVPEPSALLTLAIGAAGAWLAHSRRRRPAPPPSAAR